MPVDPRIPVAEWELGPRERMTHWDSSGSGAPSPPGGLSVAALSPLMKALRYLTTMGREVPEALEGVAAWPSDIPGTIADLTATPIESIAAAAGETFPPLRNTSLRRVVPGQTAAAIRRSLPGGSRGEPSAVPEMRSSDEDLFTTYNLTRMANPMLWPLGFNPRRWPAELAQGAANVGRVVAPISRLAAETVDAGVHGRGPLGGPLSPLAASRLNVVRDPGGNFAPPRLDQELLNLQISSEPTDVNEPAINKWINTQLRRYISRDLGSEKSPLLDMARRGAPMHLTPEEALRRANWNFGASSHALAEHYRTERGLPAESAIPWEKLEDLVLNRTTAEYQYNLALNSLRRPITNNPDWDKENTFERLPENQKFLRGLPPDTPMWSLRYGVLEDLGFAHVRDVLMEDLLAGRLRPESLGRMSVEQAVRRTAEYDAALAKKMGAAAAKREAEMPILKAYPQAEGQEKPWRWVELNKPGAFADESDRMVHSVRGYEPPKGFPDWVPESGTSGYEGYGHGGWEAIKGGKARVLSLRGPDGKPYATVEVARQDSRGGSNQRLEDWINTGQNLQEAQDRMLQFYQWANANTGAKPKGWDVFSEFLKSIGYEPPPPTFRITQIKGPQNRAPDPEALPYIQDLVRNMGPWTDDIGDLGNTGLLRLGDLGLRPKELQRMIETEYGGKPPAYITKEEWEKLIGKGYAAGGAVRAAGGSVNSHRPGLDDIVVELFNPPLDRLVEEAFA